MAMHTSVADAPWKNNQNRKTENNIGIEAYHMHMTILKCPLDCCPLCDLLYSTLLMSTPEVEKEIFLDLISTAANHHATTSTHNSCIATCCHSLTFAHPGHADRSPKIYVSQLSLGYPFMCYEQPKVKLACL